MRVKLSDIIIINPGVDEDHILGNKFVPMDLVRPFCRDVAGYNTRLHSSGAKFQNGDVLLARITPCLENGKTAFVNFLNSSEAGSGSTEFIVMRAINGVADNRYVYYLATSADFRDYAIKSMVGTSGRQRVQIDALADYELDLPDLATQKKIAATLSAFDDKIELNRQMNETLEEMGRSLFRHYFIDNPEAKNWPMVKVGDLIKPKRGKSLVARVMKKGRVPVVGGGLSAAGMHDVANTTAPVVTVSASGANAGYVSLWSVPVWSSDSSYIDSTVTPYVYYWYFFLKNKQKEIFDMQTGTGQPHIYPSHIGLLDINDAPERAISRFNVAVEPLFSKVAANNEETLLLGATRDMLAEKLIR